MRNNEFGRSMIEMLGVLAIIGVLSVLGIVGYSKAIEKHRVNRAIYHVTQIVNNTRMVFGPQGTYAGLGTTDEQVTRVLFSADIAPKDMLVLDSKGNYVVPHVFKNAFKGDISVRIGDKFVEGDKMAFVVSLGGVPKNACVSIASSAWGGNNNEGFIGLTINTAMPEDMRQANCTPTEITNKGSAVYCASESIMPLAAAVNGCASPKNNLIEMKFY